MVNENYQKTFNQFWRFVIIGIINTLIDYVILLILSKITGITGGPQIIPLNIISFSAATINSYFLNKRWAFADQSGIDQGKKFSIFLIISIIGVTINTAIVTLITSNISPMFGLSPREWLIGSKLVATAVSLVWNFIGYKIFVFKK